MQKLSHRNTAEIVLYAVRKGLIGELAMVALKRT
jgi:hypothetical protein